MRRRNCRSSIIEDNGCCDLTGSVRRPRTSGPLVGVVNDLPPIDVRARHRARRRSSGARSRRQSAALASQGALAHRGTVITRRLSPCVTQRPRRVDKLRLRGTTTIRSRTSRSCRSSRTSRWTTNWIVAGSDDARVKLLLEARRSYVRPTRSTRCGGCRPRGVILATPIYISRTATISHAAERRRQAARDAAVEPGASRSGSARGDHGRPQIRQSGNRVIG